MFPLYYEQILLWLKPWLFSDRCQASMITMKFSVGNMRCMFLQTKANSLNWIVTILISILSKWKVIKETMEISCKVKLINGGVLAYNGVQNFEGDGINKSSNFFYLQWNCILDWTLTIEEYRINADNNFAIQQNFFMIMSIISTKYVL